MELPLFPDSNIAKNYHSARMKTTCILNGSIAPHVKQTLVEQLKSGVFSMSTDGSNDKDLDKMNPITVKLFDINASRAVTRFLDMGVTQGVDAAKASTIFEAIDEVMTDNSIPWKNCIAFSVDNTSANLDGKALVICFISFSKTGSRKILFKNSPERNDLAEAEDAGIFLANEGPRLLK
ncbi:Hypothetical predicted protein [Paramuricea clavata]|uniref:Uncharacterized protein n=1 Tax=Paramuricea clavata TaxID=317549 RepID=A0A6S7I6K6_PARCT|nr:Hypothetical predicted protein [Paramuricea clavata]